MEEAKKNKATHQPMMELHSSRSCFLYGELSCLGCFDVLLERESELDIKKDEGCAEARVARSKSEAALASRRSAVEER